MQAALGYAQGAQIGIREGRAGSTSAGGVLGMWVEQTLSCLPGRHLGSGPRHTGSMESRAAQQHLGQAPSPTDLNIHAWKEGGRGIL